MVECAALSIVLKVSSWLSFRQSGPMWLFALELEKRPLIYSAVSPRQVEISVEIQTDNQETFQRSTQMTPAVVNLPAIRRHFDALLVIFGAPWKLIGPHSSMTWSTSIGQQMRHVLHCTTHTHRWWMAIFFLCHQTNRWIGRRWLHSARNGFFFCFHLACLRYRFIGSVSRFASSSLASTPTSTRILPFNLFQILWFSI